MTEKLGKILIKRHSRQYLIKLKQLKIEKELLKFYVDDTINAMAAVDAGVRFENDKRVKKEELIEEDMNIPDDDRTMKILAEIANTVYKCVQFTVDFPSKNDKNVKEAPSCLLNGQGNINDEGIVSVLDLKVSVCKNQLIHEYYKKPCAAKMAVLHTAEK